MILYDVSSEIKNQLDNDEWFIKNVTQTKNNSLVIIADRKNTKPIQRLRIRISDPYISNTGFEIIGSFLKDLSILNYKKVFNTEYFEVKEIYLRKEGVDAKISAGK